MRIPYRPTAPLGRAFIEIGPDGCATVLRILKSGWERALDLHRPEMHPGAEEVKITECLRDGMREVVNRADTPRTRKILIPPGTESRSDPGVLKPDGRTDIPLYFLMIFDECDEHDPHAIIECKRIAGNHADLCRRYVVEGVDRFRTGKYSGNHVAGFMAGYLLSGDAEDAARGVNKYLAGKRCPREHLRLSGIFDVAWAWSSRHPRPASSSPVDIHHAFLAFQPVAP